MKKYTITLNRNYLNLFKKTLLKSLIIAFSLLSIYYFPDYWKDEYTIDEYKTTIYSRMFNNETYKITGRYIFIPDHKNARNSYIPEKEIFKFFDFQSDYLYTKKINLHSYSYQHNSISDLKLLERFEAFFIITLPCILTFKIWTLLFLTAIISCLILSIKYIKNKIEIKVN